MTHVIRVIVNGAAGSVKDESSRETLVQLVTDVLPNAQVWFTTDNETVDDLIKRARADAPTLLVAGGGDGTINAVAAAIVGTEVVLGVLPLGTLNHFARDLGIPTELRDAVALLRDGRVRPIDVAIVNDRIFLNNSGLGLYPEIVRQREERQRRGASKWPAAFLATVQSLWRYRRLTLRLTIDGTQMHRRLPALLVGNNEYTTEHSIEPQRLSLQEGVLSLYLPRARGRAALIWNSIRAVIGNVGDGQWFEVLRAERMSIEARLPMLRVSLDGEVREMQGPLVYESRPGALLVMAPDSTPTQRIPALNSESADVAPSPSR